jgi:hypothetical protein
MLRKILAGAACLAVMAAAAFTIRAESAPAATPSPALVISEFGCNMFDGDGNIFFTTDTHGVVTNSNNNNVNIRCQAEVTPPATGRAAVWSQATHPGVQCSTMAGLTDNWRNVVSASGNATLTCHYKN